MSRQERVAHQLVAKYGLSSARIRAGMRGHRHLCIKPALEARQVTESDVFKWTFWHCVSASLNKMARAEPRDA
jgi:hypothetical protein